MSYRVLDPGLSYTDLTEDDLIRLWRGLYPSGSGPLGIMRTACALIENIGHMQGHNISTWPQKALEMQ